MNQPLNYVIHSFNHSFIPPPPFKHAFSPESHLSLHAGLSPDILQLLQLGLQFLPIRVGDLRFVVEQMLQLDVLLPGLLVLGVPGVAELGRTNAEVDEFRIDEAAGGSRLRLVHFAVHLTSSVAWRFFM